MPKLYFITEGHYTLTKIKKIVKAIETGVPIESLVHVKELNEMEQMVYNDPPLTPFQEALTRGIITTMQDNLDYRKAQFIKLAKSVEFIKTYQTIKTVDFSLLSFIFLLPIILSLFIWRAFQILIH